MSLNSVPMAIGTYRSSFALENDVAHLKGNTYATALGDDGSTWAFIPMAHGTNALEAASEAAVEPLTNYGFTLQTVPLSR
jgi:hypothetical protein